MKPIVCALRGGPGSHFTRRHALEQTAATGAALYLLVVIPASAYNPLHEGEQRSIRAEMAWRELALARANAAQLGLPDIQFNIQIRIGVLQATIAEFVESVDAGTVLLGAPRDAHDAHMSAASIDSLAAELRSGLGVAVEIVHPPAR